MRMTHGRSKSAAGGGKTRLNFSIDADLSVILDIFAKETQMNKSQILNNIIRPMLAMFAKTPAVEVEGVITNRIEAEHKNQEKKNVRILRELRTIVKEAKNLQEISSPDIENNTALQQKEKSFSRMATINAQIASDAQTAVRMLQNVLYVLDTIADMTRHTAFVASTETRCHAYIAELQKTLENHRPTEPKTDNWFMQAINRKRKEASIYNSQQQLRPIPLFEFREEFSDIVLDMRNRCLEMCNRMQQKRTYEEDAIFECCRYASASINEICRKDTDLVIDSYKYNESAGILNVDVSELKMLQKYSIDKVYCDGEPCKFNIIEREQNESVHPTSDFMIQFKPCNKFPENDDNTKHTITIMLSGCMEFSYDIIYKRQSEKNASFIDYHVNVIPDFEL